ncbi:MAG: GTPase HflX [Spirochaetales bacterium]|jgi:GTPase|nr:GTPase HflX [Spirochaetales bacterium]
MNEPKESAAGIYSTKVETAFLVSISYPSMEAGTAEAHVDELSELVNTMGLSVSGTSIVKLKKPSSRFLVGSGKAEELIETAKDLEVDCIIFDDDLAPSQQRNWEELSDLCVIDRQEVILDIFADRAHTREAVLQVGLARMEYSLPRLTRAWTHLSRQRGGSKGTRGEGETQLEVDRRIVLRKIHRLKKELEKVGAQRGTRRKMRSSVPIPTAAIVGYTNAGKSSMLNALTGAEALVEDKLFATLDPTTRRLEIQNGAEALLTDTVGFIRKLPHDLVDAFKSTLEETVLADMLIHVLDVSNPEVQHHYETTISVLKELGAGEKPSIIVFNKTDLVKDDGTIDFLKDLFPGAMFVSVKSGEGLEDIIREIKTILYDTIPVEDYLIPSDRYDLAALIHRTGRVLHEEYGDTGVMIKAQLPEKIRGRCAAYLVQQYAPK